MFLYVIRCDVHSLEYGVLGLWARLMGAIDVDKTEHDIFKVTFNAHSSNNGDIPISSSSFALHIVLPVLNNGSPKGSLGSFYSNLGYGLLTNKQLVHLKRHDDNHPFITELIAIKVLIKK